MPRNRPSALRAGQPLRPVWSTSPPHRLRGLSLRTCIAIHRAERQIRNSYGPNYFFPGVTAAALRRYRAFLHSSGPHSSWYPEYAVIREGRYALNDVRHARDVLAAVANLLPPRPRGELRRLLTPLDAAFLQRTLPEPSIPGGRQRPLGWWHRRLTPDDPSSQGSLIFDVLGTE